jgi:hypothetical protein
LNPDPFLYFPPPMLSLPIKLQSHLIPSLYPVAPGRRPDPVAPGRDPRGFARTEVAIIIMGVA